MVSKSSCVSLTFKNKGKKEIKRQKKDKKWFFVSIFFCSLSIKTSLCEVVSFHIVIPQSIDTCTLPVHYLFHFQALSCVYIKRNKNKSQIFLQQLFFCSPHLSAFIKQFYFVSESAKLMLPLATRSNLLSFWL